ncbi:coiled-coil domain-containing protein 169-like isoform X2 [Entelurus aequoreus]|uniref:coiled-coil domain-containing protein 169-like n=1 Tax=Entelurus aequoreus TaxID=161455 RepID=UPI002B1DDE90|nr:coiled-coil domain-containing protein 169-like [Entelurus aequoreus]XP_061902178.1 coiled-coil domain-containing protein 169-like isoform X2 [Entelurus aequoreus]
MSKDSGRHDMARLRVELEQEREIKDMLEESVRDLGCTMRELQDRLHGVDREDNEWKTRYETQTEVNAQLQRQTSLVHERLEDLRGKPMDRLASIRSYDDMPTEALRQRLKLLTDDKSQLRSQLMDYRIRIEQEGKAFHRTNDERRAYLSEIAKLSSTVEAQRRQYSMPPQRAAESQPRAKQWSRKSEGDAKRGKAKESEGGGGHVKGGGGPKAQHGSRLPTLKHHVKH